MLTPDDLVFLHHLESVVAERPEYVYENPECMYFTRPTEETAQPACVLGHVFSRMGIPAGWFVYQNESTARQVMNDEFSPLYGKYVFSDPVIALARRVQAHQDGQVPWGEALRQALAEDPTGQTPGYISIEEFIRAHADTQSMEAYLASEHAGVVVPDTVASILVEHPESIISS
jgi:hypothetical protein